MSHRILFVRRYPTLTWDEALMVHYGKADPPENVPVNPADIHALATDVLDLLGDDISVSLGTGSLELYDERTGLRLDLAEDQGQLDVPTDHDPQTTLLTTRLSAIVESATGLSAWDVRLGRPLERAVDR